MPDKITQYWEKVTSEARSKSFKYPIYRMFFDVDEVACTFLEDMVAAYPMLEKDLEDKSWDITLGPDQEYIVLAVQDALDIIEQYLETV